MKHTVIIWEMSKTEVVTYNIRTRIIITEEDIKELALTKFREQYTEMGKYNYTADIDKTEI
jgi:hypothetical protein